MFPYFIITVGVLQTPLMLHQPTVMFPLTSIHVTFRKEEISVKVLGDGSCRELEGQFVLANTERSLQHSNSDGKFGITGPLSATPKKKHPSYTLIVGTQSQ